MKFTKINFNRGEFYYVGEGYDSYNGWVAEGIGAMVWNENKKVICCDSFYNSDPNGLGFEYEPAKKQGIFSTYKNMNCYGPSMIFAYEEGLWYKNYDDYGRGKNFSVFVLYNGNYIIYEENYGGIQSGVAYFDGYLYFIKMREGFDVIEKRTIKYVGDDYKFTCKRMFCMELDYSRPIYNKSSTTKTGLHYDLGTQLLSSSGTTYWGYGAIKWSDGSYYFGEWYDDNREGMGCFVDEDGNKHLGKYYKNQKYGSVLSLYSNGLIRMGNWVEGKREGISFEIHDNCVVIINYKNNSVYGNKFEVKKGAEAVSEFNSSGNVGRYYY